ncbi:hypothetical protein H8356DRAFT_1337168 [Neocallimastix lanati (nom. inval.)]|nr:hypothetical protein H8356DRAFT_1337168 [Neocallimastix sp. JGI-2020a]
MNIEKENNTELFFKELKSKSYLCIINDDELSKILKDPEYILFKSENDTTIENNYFYTIIIRYCFDPTKRDIEDFEDMEVWIEDYHKIFYNTISSTSNDKFNDNFEIKYR